MNKNIQICVTRIALCLMVFVLGGYIHTAKAWDIQGTSDSLKYIGHAFVKIKTLEGKVIYIDPFNVNDFSDSADVVLITHEHDDHNDLSRVKQKTGCQVIRSANAIQGGVYQSFTIGNIKVKAVAAYDNNYHNKSACVGYVVEFNGIKLYHAGDTGKIPEMADLASQNITYALLPMDGIYTMTPEEVTQVSAMIQAKGDIPIHTTPPPGGYDNAIVARFTSSHKLIVKPGSTIALNNTATSVDQSSLSPEGFRLEQNYPNPFNPSTRIDFVLSGSSFVSLKIYDVLGKEVGTLISENLQAGNYSRQWNAAGMPSGIYFYTLQAGKNTETKKLVLVK